MTSVAYSLSPTVVLALIAQADPIHLPGQPGAPVEANFDWKGKPGLNGIWRRSGESISQAGATRCHRRS
jgi:hypothetical protein